LEESRAASAFGHFSGGAPDRSAGSSIGASRIARVWATTGGESGADRQQQQD
jgi:hypothetical protein